MKLHSESISVMLSYIQNKRDKHISAIHCISEFNLYTKDNKKLLLALRLNWIENGNKILNDI